MSQQPLASSFPRPSKALIVLMAVIGCVWVMFAMAQNWGGADSTAFNLLAGNSEALFRGHIWRPFTASLMHDPRQPTHPLFVVLMLYFFVPPLQERWGTRRLFVFLFGCAAAAFVLEAGLSLVSPLGNHKWYGGMLMADAATVAWAFTYRDQVIRLFFVLPMKPLLLVGLLVLWHIVQVIARAPNPEGMFAPFGAMLAGWLFCDSGPGRRVWLRFKLQRLQRQVDGMARKRSGGKRSASHLQVIRGGKDDDKRNLH